MSTFITSIHVNVQQRKKHKRKKIKGKQIKKEEVKLSLFADDMIPHYEDPTDHTKGHLELVNSAKQKKQN